MSPQKQSDLYRFLSACDLAVVSSIGADGAPQSAVVGIAVTTDLEIVFDTVNASRKYRNLTANPGCSLTLWLGERTVQYEGAAEVPTGETLVRCQEAYFAKMPEGRDRQNWPGIAYFLVRPRWIRFSDFSIQPPLMEEFSF